MAQALDTLMEALREQSFKSARTDPPGTVRESLARFLRELRSYLTHHRGMSRGLAQQDIRLAAILPILRRNRRQLLDLSHDLCGRVRRLDVEGALQVATTLATGSRDGAIR